MRLSYRVMLFWEAYALWLGGIGGAAIAFFVAYPQENVLRLTAILALALFGGTGLSIIHLRASTTQAVARLKAAGYFGDLISWGRSATIAALFLLAVALFGMMAPAYPAYKYVFLASVGIAGLAFIRLFWTILKIDLSKSAVSQNSVARH